jgi:hypothetical protein
MRWFDHPDGRVWAGWHETLGPVVYDPADQEGVPSHQVRLFVESKGRLLLLPRSATKRRIVGRSDGPALQRAVDAYCRSRAAARPAVPAPPSRRYGPPSVMSIPGNQQTPVDRRTGSRTQACAGCGKPIPPERLDAVPDAVRCVGCEATAERQGKGSKPSAYDPGEAWFARSEHWRYRGRRRRG